MRRLDFTTIAALIGRSDKLLLTPSDLGVFPHPLVEKGFLVEAGRADCILWLCGDGYFERVTRGIIGGEVKYSVYCPENGTARTLEPHGKYRHNSELSPKEKIAVTRDDDGIFPTTAGLGLNETEKIEKETGDFAGNYGGAFLVRYKGECFYTHKRPDTRALQHKGQD